MVDFGGVIDWFIICIVGYCHQFNSKGNYKVISAGISGGLMLVLDALVAEYSVGPNSFSEGFFVGLLRHL